MLKMEFISEEHTMELACRFFLCAPKRIHMNPKSLAVRSENAFWHYKHVLMNSPDVEIE
jgi:hypothetical protein